jgi:transcriptional regulator with PAS, ATPase and Fis domain
LSLPIELQSLVDVHDQPFVIIDRNRRVVVINQAFQDAYLVRRSDAVGKPCYTLLTRSDRPCPCGPGGSSCPFGSVFKGQGAKVTAHPYRDARNRQHQVRIQGYALAASDGEIYLGELVQEDAVHRHEETGKCLPSPPEMVGSSPAFQDTLAQLRFAGGCGAPVLLQGETGTGKELAASYVHCHSARRDGPFQILDCSTLTEDLFESEVFGHERGAFTGSTATKPGLFELADQGTLFLDEVGELPPTVQGKLLRALEIGEYRRVGGTEIRRASVRTIAASNRELKGAPWFRQDLYFRMACMTVRLPNLRQRLSDIPELAQVLLQRIAKSSDRPYVIDDDALDFLRQYDYPGNIRELRNVLWVAAINSSDGRISGELVATALPAAPPPAALSLLLPPQPIGSSEWRGVHSHTADRASGTPMPCRPAAASSSLPEVEAEHLTAVLHRHNGNRRAAAGELGISERTVYRKLRKHNLG